MHVSVEDEALDDLQRGGQERGVVEGASSQAAPLLQGNQTAAVVSIVRGSQLSKPQASARRC